MTQLTEVLLHHGLQDVCTDGFTCLEPDKFERHLTHLLKRYAANLKPQTKMEREAVWFVHAKARYASRAIQLSIHPGLSIGLDRKTLASRRRRIGSNGAILGRR